MPTPPKLANAFRDVWIIKIFREAETHHLADSDGHVRPEVVHGGADEDGAVGDDEATGGNPEDNGDSGDSGDYGGKGVKVREWDNPEIGAKEYQYDVWRTPISNLRQTSGSTNRGVITCVIT